MRIQFGQSQSFNSVSRVMRSLSLAAVFGAGSVIMLAGSAAQASPIANAGFETGDLSGWTLDGVQLPQDYVGDNTLAKDDTNHTTANFVQQTNDGSTVAGEGGALTSLVDINPTNGNYFARISNDGSGNGFEGSYLYQGLDITAGMSALSFDVQFLTDESTDSMWDFGGVALVDSTSLNVLREFVLDHDPTTGTSLADAHTSPVASGGFDLSTGWISHSFDLTGLAGTNAYFVAYVTNTGDTEQVSQLLLDNVSLKAGTTKVPEPATLSLFAMGLAGVGFAARRRKSA